MGNAKTKRLKNGMTHRQHDNLMEWFQRMAEEGTVMTDATRIFNDLSVDEQQGIIRRPWYSRDTGNPINRPTTTRGSKCFPTQSIKSEPLSTETSDASLGGRG